MDEEQAWIRGALSGDHQAFARLVEAYQTQVYNLAYRMLGNAQDAEDAAQETFLRAYSRLKSYDLERPFGSWLLAIAAHHCIDRLRRRRFPSLSLDDLPPWRWLPADIPDPEESVLRQDRADQIQRLLDQLPADYRLAIVLRYWHDLSYREIAQATGSTESAVKSRLHRARRMLMEAAGKQQGGEEAVVGRAVVWGSKDGHRDQEVRRDALQRS